MQQRKITEVAKNIEYLEIQLEKNENKDAESALFNNR